MFHGVVVGLSSLELFKRHLHVALGDGLGAIMVVLG